MELTLKLHSFEREKLIEIELRTRENSDVFNSLDEIYLVFTSKKQIFFLFYTIHRHFPIHKAGGENAKNKNF